MRVGGSENDLIDINSRQLSLLFERILNVRNVNI